MIVTNPDPGSRLPYLLRARLGDGLAFRTSGPASAEVWAAWHGAH